MRNCLLIFVLLLSIHSFAQKNTNLEKQLDSLTQLIDFSYKTGKLITEKEYFEEISEILTKISPERISIEVHTDSKGNAENNLLISQNLAEEIKQILTEFGIEDSLIETIGWGDNRPLGCIIDPEESKNRNRRVEFIIRK